MTVPEKIFALWSADATATALVPAARFKFAGPYQNISSPYVIFQPVFTSRYRTIAEGAADMMEYGTYQFSIFAASSSVAETIRRKLIDVLDGNKDGFNFHYQTGRFVDEAADKTLVLYAADFLATSA